MIRSLLATVALIGATAPIAVTAQEPRTERVSYAGLDLHSAAGVAILHQRIHRALRSVCDPNTSDLLQAHRMERRCIAETQPSVDAQLAAIGLSEPGRVSVLIAAR